MKLQWNRTLTAAASALVLALAGLMIAVPLATRHNAMERAVADLEQLPPEQMLPALRGLTASHERSLPLLAGCLCSSEAELVEAAGLLIQERLTAWEALPADLATARQAQLIGALADRSQALGPAGHEIARGLVHRALRRPALPGDPHSAAILASCRTILEAAGPADGDRARSFTTAENRRSLR